MNEPLSKIDLRLTLDYILNNPEGITFERKWLFKPNWELGLTVGKLSNSIIWMLNAEGWIIVLWVNDWEIQDLWQLDNTKLNDFRQIWKDIIIPPSNIEIEEIDIDWRLVFLYHINWDKERVFCNKNNEKVYLRMWDETKELNRDWIRKLEYDKSIRKFEEEIRWDFDETDFRWTVIDYYKEKMQYEWDYRDLLVNRYLAVKEDWIYKYKNSAILLFADKPEKYISSSSIRYIRYSWNEQETWVRLNVIKDKTFEGCIPRLIELIKRFLNDIFKDYYFLDLDSWKFRKISEYPEDAWLEWIVNALTHRSYNLQWNVVYIKHFDNRLEISNSWPLPSIVTVENIKTTRFSRNPRIARVLSDLWYVRELNEWVNRIYQSMAKSLLSEPEYKNENDIVTLILKNNVSESEDTIPENIINKIERLFPSFNETEKSLINYFLINKRWNIQEISETIKISDRTIRRYLNNFMDEWLIIKSWHKIRDKNAIYKLNYQN